MSDKRHPLSWPAGRLRTPPARRKDAPFRSDGRRVNPNIAFGRLQAQLDLLGAQSVILSTNLELRLDGLPRSDRREPADPGAALYFRLKGSDTVFACDLWDTVADNIVAIAKHIEALRGMDRWGTGTLEQAFAGYQQLPAPEQWWQVLGLPGEGAAAHDVKQAYRQLAAAAHPDRGGSTAAMARLNAARDDGLRSLSQ